jgi:hypothetical protein
MKRHAREMGSGVISTRSPQVEPRCIYGYLELGYCSDSCVTRQTFRSLEGLVFLYDDRDYYYVVGKQAV